MAPIADERLDAGRGGRVDARKITPAAVRVVDVPGTGPRCSGTCARSTRCRARRLVGATPATVEELQLELLVADRDHVEKRLERVRQQAKSGDPKLRKEVAELERLLAHVEAGRTLARLRRGAAARARAADDEAGHGRRERRRPASTWRSRRSWPSWTRRRRPRSARRPLGARRGRRRLNEALDLVTFFTAGEKETRAWTLRRGQTALDAAGTIHSDIARGFIRCEVIRWQRPGRVRLARRGGEARPAAPRGQGRTSSRTATC